MRLGSSTGTPPSSSYNRPFQSPRNNAEASTHFAVVIAVLLPPAPGRTNGEEAMPVKSGASFRASALPVIVMAQLLAAAVLTLTLVWVLHFRDGVSWEFNSTTQLVYTVRQYTYCSDLFEKKKLVGTGKRKLQLRRCSLGPHVRGKWTHDGRHLSMQHA